MLYQIRLKRLSQLAICSKARLAGDTKTMAKQAKKKTVYRSSVKGTFVTKRFAETHPKTTEKEKVRTGN